MKTKKDTIPPQHLEDWEKELREDAHKALSASKKGGARLGAGRKSKRYVKTALNLTPDARANLEKLAGEGTLSDAANKLLLEHRG